MSSEWALYSLGQVAENGKEGLIDGPFGSALPANLYTPSGVPVIRGSNLSKGQVKFRDDEFVFVSNETASRLSRAQCIADDIIFTKKGTLGQIGIVPKGKFQTYLLSSNQMRLRVNRKLLLPDFAYYYLAQESSITKIIRDSEHTGVPKINLGYLREFPILVPPISTQTSIISILSALDDRIALLRETNATLEAIAQALFKSWFVDFDPVRAKQQGRPPESLDPATAALFPDDFEDTELGPVPKGWRVKGIDQTCDLGRGSSPRPIQKFMGGDVPWIKIADATASDGMFVFETKEGIIQDGVKNSVSVQPGDLIMSNSASCGITVFVELHGCIHDGWLYFKNYKETSKNFLFFWLRKIAEHLVHIADGSVQKNLNIALVSSQKILCPPSEILNRFDSIVGPLLERIRENCVQAQTLATLRDTLLPRLISGQLRLPEAQSFVEEVTA